MILALTFLSVFTAAMLLMLQDRWIRLSPHDARKQLAQGMWSALRDDASQLRHSVRGSLSPAGKSELE
jgi:hypothetical protein